MELLAQYIRVRIQTIDQLSDYISIIANLAFINEFNAEANDLFACYRLQEVIKSELEVRLLPFMTRGVFAEVECVPDHKNPGNIITSWYLTNAKGEVLDPNEAIRRMNKWK